MSRRDDPQEMDRMRAWLERAAAVLEVDAQVVLDREADLLKLASYTARNTSRPGTPLTAFLVGLAAGKADPSEMSNIAADKIQLLIEEIEEHYMEESE
ncbi:MAG: DUF6457 domain-containing protein [Actinomycetaceae bacterium]|nr:DUF6457 domain-containing protein [Actinomycetaceae bacterium]